MQERSDTDGKVYSVQYFERAVFEYHPENQPAYDVLLSQLGTFRLQEPDQPAQTVGIEHNSGVRMALTFLVKNEASYEVANVADIICLLSGMLNG